jgi:N6-adenosine-specific RNA methylase IME4
MPKKPSRELTVIKPGELQLTRRQWAKRLNDQWDVIRQTAVTGFIELGRDLHRAKAGLEHGQWINVLDSDLKFHRRVASMFMRIATWCDSQMGVIDSHLAKMLPPDYNTIDKIARLDEVTFKRLVKDGTICPTLQRNEVSSILRTTRVQADEYRILNLVPRVGKFRTIVIDPAWDYDWLSIAARAKPGYAMQTIEQLRELDVAAWADEEEGCQMYCWTTNNFMSEACKLVEHWGFQHRTVITWIKPPPFGLGSYYRNSTEHMIFATRGETTTRPAAASIPTHFEAPRGKHSEKPEKSYEIIRAGSYPPYGEANQREERSDFTNLFVEAGTEAAAG